MSHVIQSLFCCLRVSLINLKNWGRGKIAFACVKIYRRLYLLTRRCQTGWRRFLRKVRRGFREPWNWSGLLMASGRGPVILVGLQQFISGAGKAFLLKRWGSHGDETTWWLEIPIPYAKKGLAE